MLVCILPIRAASSVSFTPAQAARLVSFPIWALRSLLCICAILYPEPEELLGCLMLAGPQQENQQEQLAGHHAINCLTATTGECYTGLCSAVAGGLLVVPAHQLSVYQPHRPMPAVPLPAPALGRNTYSATRTATVLQPSVLQARMQHNQIAM